MITDFDTEDSNLDEAIASAYSDLKSFSADEEGYQKAVDQLSKLYALKNQTAQLNLQTQTAAAAHVLAETKHQLEIDQHQLALDESRWQEEQAEKSFFERVDPSTVLTVAGNLVIALIVIKYEQKSVISTKALSFLKKF